LSQEIAYYDRDASGSISQQATTNGKLIQSGIAEKLGIVIQAISTFVAAFVIAFVTQWKLTLILIFMVPTLLIVLGTAGGIDARIETKILQVYAQAGSFAENVLGGVRTLQAFSLRPRVMATYDSYLRDAYTRGIRKNKLYGIVLEDNISSSTPAWAWRSGRASPCSTAARFLTLEPSLCQYPSSRKPAARLPFIIKIPGLTKSLVFSSPSSWLRVRSCK
jgi:ABC-type multidrug transport system fused ATPase/permease subunit